jgi:hypothetical protein
MPFIHHGEVICGGIIEYFWVIHIVMLFHFIHKIYRQRSSLIYNLYVTSMLFFLISFLVQQLY